VVDGRDVGSLNEGSDSEACGRGSVKVSIQSGMNAPS